MIRTSKLIATLAGAATPAALSISSLGPHLTGASVGPFAQRKDIIELPQPLKDRLVTQRRLDRCGPRFFPSQRGFVLSELLTAVPAPFPTASFTAG